VTIADLIVTRLCEAGVTAIFGVPGGGSNLDLIEAAGRVSLPFVLTATETGGAIAALAQSEASGHLGACLTTLGPGVASVVNGIGCALLDRAPLVVFTDTHPTSSRGLFTHQQLDHRALLAPVTKWSSTLQVESADEDLCRAIATATTPPFGPVHLDVAPDVASRPGPFGLGETRGSGPLGPGKAERETPASDDVRRAPHDDRLFTSARRPLLIVGLGTRRRNDALAVRSLCEERSLPAMVTYKAKGVVPDDHPSFAGVFTNAAIEAPIVAGADLLIGVGLDPVELIPRRWSYPQPVVYCGTWRVDDRHVPFAAQMIGDVPTSLKEIEDGLPATDWDLSNVRQLVALQRRQLASASDGLTPHRVVSIAAERLASRCRVTVDAGAHMFPTTMLWPVFEPNQMLISNGLSTMGFALPAAIGAALVDRGRPVVALTGDGGLLMCLGELLTAARERLRIIVIVFNDAALSLIKVKQQQKQYTPTGVDLSPAAWRGVAEAFGVTPFTASSAAELEQSVEMALDCDGPALIDARIDPADYGSMLRTIRG